MRDKKSSHKNKNQANPNSEHHQPSDQSHQHHHQMMLNDFKKRFWISLIITLPVLLLSPTIQDWFNFSIKFTGSNYLLFALASFIYFFGGWPFLSGLISEMKQKNPGMMTLIAMAITVAYVYSSATVFGLSGDSFFWELATLVVVMLAGHWIEMRSVMSASGALQELMELMPNQAHKQQNGDFVDVKVQELVEDDIILIKPGEKVPSDGIIDEGQSYIDESVLTGESKPVKKEKGDEVIAGSINGKSSFKVKVKASQENSYLSKVIKMVEEAQEKKSQTQHLADKAAFWLTIIALSVGVITLSAWLLIGETFVFALARMATVLVIACPHALGLAIPLVIAISTSYSARNQLLIRNRTAFENSRRINCIIFDKTGTLTVGNFGVTRYDSFNNELDKKEILRLAAGLEQNSEHPIALGIINKAKEEKLELPQSQNFENITGEGIQGKVENREIKIVGRGYLQKNNLEVEEIKESDQAETIVYLLTNDEPSGYIALADQLRETSAEATKKLQEMEIEVYMMTGDTESVAKAISEKLSIEGYFAEVLPDEKQDKVIELQSKGKFVAMTGDGVNDAPALAQADVGIAIGLGTDVAAETADIVLVESDPKDVSTLIEFGRATYKKMIQNLIYATAYNVVAIPLGAGVLYGAGIVIDPAIGAILMSLSTVAVAVNAQFLRNKLKKN
ncbi:MAG: copper-translocating P-type ATPase [Cyclobacteriaceae bacterium]